MRRALLATTALLLVMLAVVLPTVATAHPPSWGDTHYYTRIWAEGTCGQVTGYPCGGVFRVDVQYYVGEHSRVGIAFWTERGRYCSTLLRIQNDGGPYVAQVYYLGCDP